MKAVFVTAVLTAAQLLAAEFVKIGGEFVYRDTLHFEEPAANLQSLSVEAVNGEIALTGEDRSSIRVIAAIEVRAEELDEGKEYLSKFRPVVKRDGDQLKVYAEYPDSKWSWNEVSADVDFVISAPRSLDLNASCANGEIESTDMTGSADLECANGEITFLSAMGVSGHLNTSCANGEVVVDIGALNGNSEFSTANGEISVTVHSSLGGNINASTANGEIVLALPENSDMRVTASSVVNGAITSDWSGDREKKIIGDEFELVVNEGKYIVECSTVNGQIAIRKANRAN